MQHRNWKIRIHDILNSIAAIKDYTEGMNFDSFVSDRKTVDAVVRNLIIIGEAVARLPEDVSAANPEIPWYEMKGMRNFVVHEYFGVSDKILWDTLKVDLPPLVPLLEKLVP